MQLWAGAGPVPPSPCFLFGTAPCLFQGLPLPPPLPLGCHCTKDYFGDSSARLLSLLLPPLERPKPVPVRKAVCNVDEQSLPASSIPRSFLRLLSHPFSPHWGQCVSRNNNLAGASYTSKFPESQFSLAPSNIKCYLRPNYLTGPCTTMTRH